MGVAEVLPFSMLREYNGEEAKLCLGGAGCCGTKVEA